MLLEKLLWVVSLAGALLGVSLLVVLHELGHYLVARWCGMHVHKFSIGFGPVIYKKRVGHTDYQIAALPLGGFVQIHGLGIDESMLNETPADEGSETKSEQQESTEPPSSTTVQEDPYAGQGFQDKPVWQRVAVIAAGPVANIALAVVMFIGIGWLFATPLGVLTNTPASESTAAQIGLQEGDLIVAINGHSLSTWEELSWRIGGYANQEAVLTIHRQSGESFDIMTLPFTVPENIGGIGFIDGLVRPAYHRASSMPIITSVVLAWSRTMQLTRQQVLILWRKVFGSEHTRNQGRFLGPRGIIVELQKALGAGAGPFLTLLAMISVGLFFFNLLPLPPLDGARLTFLGIELVRGRPVPAQTEIIVSNIGFLFIIGLLVYVTVSGG